MSLRLRLVAMFDASVSATVAEGVPEVEDPAGVATAEP